MGLSLSSSVDEGQLKEGSVSSLRRSNSGLVIGIDSTSIIPWSAVAITERHRFQMRVDQHPCSDKQSVSRHRPPPTSIHARRTAPTLASDRQSRMPKRCGAPLPTAVQGKRPYVDTRCSKLDDKIRCSTFFLYHVILSILKNALYFNTFIMLLTV